MEKLEQLLAVFWAEHDPTELNRQGLDIGDQYRPVIFVQRGLATCHVSLAS